MSALQVNTLKIMRVAVIDLGTNTCNLLIADLNNSKYSILHQSKQLVKLGDDKIKANEISPEATKRTINAFQVHKRIIDESHVDMVRVVATSAVRSSENKIEYLEQISEQTGWIVKVISGDKEAEHIFNGVLLAIKEFNDPSLVLDIGGGSNEIILAREKRLIQKESRPTGMARIINQFKVSNPILPQEIAILQNFFSQEHKDAISTSKKMGVKTMLGCSGAFDTIADIIDEVDPGEKTRTSQSISLEDFYSVFDRLIASNRDERLKLKGMDMVRVDLIVPAVVLIEHLISEIGINRIIQTDYALREGILYELLNTQKTALIH